MGGHSTGGNLYQKCPQDRFKFDLAETSLAGRRTTCEKIQRAPTRKPERPIPPKPKSLETSKNVASDALSKPEVQVISIQLVIDMVKHEFRIR